MLWCMFFFVISSFCRSARSLNFGDSRCTRALTLACAVGEQVWALIKSMETSYKSTCFVVFILFWRMCFRIKCFPLTLHFVYGRIKLYHKWLLCGLLLKVPYGFDCGWCLSWWVDSSPTGNHLKSCCISHVADPARRAPSGSSFDRRSDHVGGDIFQGQGRETTFCPNDPGNHNQGKSADWLMCKDSQDSQRLGWKDGPGLMWDIWMR